MLAGFVVLVFLFVGMGISYFLGEYKDTTTTERDAYTQQNQPVQKSASSADNAGLADNKDSGDTATIRPPESVAPISLFGGFRDVPPENDKNSTEHERIAILKPKQFIDTVTSYFNRQIQSIAPRANERVFTDAEMLDLIWPAEYRKRLKVVRDFMVHDGFLVASETGDLSTEAEMYQFFNDMNAYARQKDWITKEQFDAFSKGIASVLPKTVEAEKNLYRRGIPLTTTTSANRALSPHTNRKDLTRNLWGEVLSVMTAPRSAQAAYVPGEILCYKDDAPLSPLPGYNAFAPCCNCGLHCSFGCTYLQNCGPYGAACTVQFGCLNLMCAGSLNAIYDPTTGLCGCG